MKIGRRKWLAKTGATGLALGIAPYGFAKKRRKLRVLGTHVTLQEELRRQAELDLDLDIVYEPGGSAAVLHAAATRPESFDLYEQWSNSIRLLWQAGSIQPIDAKRLSHWDEINDLTKTGKLTPEARIGAGDAPNKILFVQDDRRLGSERTDRLSFLPYVHNTDSFGYNTGIVERGVPYETESWASLFDPRWSGRVALVNEPTIGLFDAALAAQAAGLVEFEDIGSMSKAEVDALFKVMIDLQRDGHFRGVWSSVPRSVDLMASGQTVIQSMFSPGVYELKGRGIDCVYASPKEGFRGWHGVMCLSSRTEGDIKDAAYDYMNWWTSGWPGAFIARQGYYISTPERSREYLDAAEWDYWYEGKPARKQLKGTDGKIVAKQGEVRDGGSYQRRFGNIAVWNTVMDTYDYSLTRWNEFLSAR